MFTKNHIYRLHYDHIYTCLALRGHSTCVRNYRNIVSLRLVATFHTLLITGTLFKLEPKKGVIQSRENL